MQFDWAILVSLVGLLVAGGLAWFFYKRTMDMTKEMKEFLITLIVNSSPDPKTLERLLEDNKNTGQWRGTVEKIPGTDNYRIAWHQQEITPLTIQSTITVNAPTVTQYPPKPRNNETTKS